MYARENIVHPDGKTGVTVSYTHLDVYKRQGMAMANKEKKIEGRLGYNSENGRYGLLISDLWEHTGFHCGEGLEVKVDDKWVKTRMEMDIARNWYLVDTPYIGDLEYVRARI